ncbi:hypothetical protein J3E69DRAFT_127724 [Trichoderma sp. SZMC 28015]
MRPTSGSVVSCPRPAGPCLVSYLWHSLASPALVQVMSCLVLCSVLYVQYHHIPASQHPSLVKLFPHGHVGSGGVPGLGSGETVERLLLAWPPGFNDPSAKVEILGAMCVESKRGTSAIDRACWLVKTSSAKGFTCVFFFFFFFVCSLAGIPL